MTCFFTLGLLRAGQVYFNWGKLSSPWKYHHFLFCFNELLFVIISAIQLDLERCKWPSLHYLIISWSFGGQEGWVLRGFIKTSNNANGVPLVLLKVSGQFKLQILLDISNWLKITVKTEYDNKPLYTLKTLAISS